MDRARTIDWLVQEWRHGALAAALLVGIAAPPGVVAQGSGTISGTVTTTAGASRAVRVTMDQRVCGNELPDEAVVADAMGHLANAVVTLVGVRSRSNAAAAGIVNEKCRFAPHVQIVRPHAVMATSSTDPILHTTNAQIEGGRSLFNVAVPLPGIRINKSLAGAGVVRLSCNTHPWMRGWVIVTDQVSAVTDADGSFALADVPAGTYELRVWHETLKAAPQKVVVAAGKPTTVRAEMQ